MNTNLSNTQAQAVERLTRNIDRIHKQKGRKAFIHQYSTIISVAIYFEDTKSKIECILPTSESELIDKFCDFIECSKLSSKAQGARDFGSEAA